MSILSVFKEYGAAKNISELFVTGGRAFPHVADGIEGVAKAFKSGAGAAGVFKAGLSGVWGIMNAHPIAATIAAVAALAAIFDVVHVSAAEANEAMNEAFSEYESAKEKVASVNSEIEETQSKIDELNAKGGLTLVEKTELDNLKLANAELQRTLDLAEKEEAAKARVAAESALDAYKKNFRYDISEEQTEYYLNLNKPNVSTNASDARAAAAYIPIAYEINDESNISAQIANVKGLIDKRDAIGSENSETWIDYNNQINDATDSIWEQVSSLQEYKRNLESIPASQRTIAETEAIAEITDDIDYIYQKLDPNTWKQWKLDDIFSKDTFSDAKKELVKLAAETDNVGISVSYLESKYPKLAEEIKNSGLDIQDVVKEINSEAGIINVEEITKQIWSESTSGNGSWARANEDVQEWLSNLSVSDLKLAYEISLNKDTAYWDLETWKQELNEFKAEYSNINIDITAESDRISNVSSAISESLSATGLSDEAITNIKDAYSDLESYDPSSLFENTADGIHLNREALEALEAEYETLKRQEFSDEMTRLQEECAKTKKELRDLDSGTEAYNKTLSILNSYEDQINELAQLQSQYNGLTSAFNKWQQAQSSSNERDSYESIGAAYEDMQKLVSQGWYGDESLNSYLDMLLGVENRSENVVSDFAKLSETISGTEHSLMDYWQYDDSGNLTTDGIFLFLDDVANKFGDTYAKINDEGLYEFDFTGDKIKEVADAFGISIEMIELFERAMIDAGFAVDIGTESIVKDMNDKLRNLQTNDKISADINVGIDLDNDDLGLIKETIDKLKSDRLEIDADVDPELAQELDSIIAKCEESYYLRINTESGGGLDEAISIINELKKLTVTVDSSVENLGQITKLTTLLSKLPESVQVAVGVSQDNLGDASAILSQLANNPESISIPVSYDQTQAAVADVEWGDIPDIETRTVSLRGQWDEIEEIPDKTVWLNGRWRSIEDISGFGGKSKAQGTAFAQGNWGTKDSGVALMGEEGPEIKVSPKSGKWELVGKDSAEFSRYEKGSIIFNAAQTREILKYGKIKHGKKRGKSFARGTISDGPAFAKKSFDLAIMTDFEGAKSVVTNHNKSKNSGKGGQPRETTPSDSWKSNSVEKVEEDLKVVDWIEVAIQRAEQAVTRFANTASNAFRSLASRLTSSDDAIEKITEEIELQQKAYDRYIHEANSVGLSDDLAEKVRNGAIDITKYDADTRELISSYQEWYDKAISCSDAVDTLHESVAELYQENFDNINADFDNQLSMIEHLSKTYENRIDKMEQQGYLASTELYNSLSDAEMQNIDILKSELLGLGQAFNSAVNSGEIAEYSEAWYSMKLEMLETEQAIQDAELKLAEYAKTMREIEWDHFDYLQEKISGITEESDFLIDLLSNSDLFDENGGMTADGMATVGLHAQNYNVAMAQAEKYAAEVSKLNSDLANDPNNNDIIERREELLKLQRDSIAAAEDEKQAMIDMAQEGIGLQLDSIRELIDEYTNALDSAKDLHDYQKQISDKTSNIASLEKRRIALSGDTSEESRAEMQKLMVELKEAQEDLSETEYERNISNQKELLDNLYSELELTLNSRLDNVDVLISEMITATNENAGLISETLTQAAESVGYELSDSIEAIWADSVSGVTTVIANYADGLGSQITSVNVVLNTISENVAGIVRISDAIAGSETVGVKAYKTGGIIDYTGLAQVHGNPGKPELALNASDTENFLELRDCLREMANRSVDLLSPVSGYENIGSVSHIGVLDFGDVSKDITPMSVSQNQNFSWGDIVISIDRVENYDDFVDKLQHDRKFEKMIQAISVNLLAGGSSLDKYKQSWKR